MASRTRLGLRSEKQTGPELEQRWATFKCSDLLREETERLAGPKRIEKIHWILACDELELGREEAIAYRTALF